VIHLDAARAILDMGRRIGAGHRADEQLEGAVALHNILEQEGIAYLADEVGMGKTYVALGALALFRHFNPGFRVLVIAPRENIQLKRVKGVDGRPARPLVACDSLLDLLEQVTLDPHRDFFTRLSSFSLPLGGSQDSVDADSVRRLRDGLRSSLPWMPAEVFDLRTKRDLKDNFARALNCALPVFDLVVVDEAHNLKGGFQASGASRNRVLGTLFGHPRARGPARTFSRFGSRARRVLFLSATPVEETYLHLWNQLDVFDKAQPFPRLADDQADEDIQKEEARRFLIRRVTEIPIGQARLTKNLYRREWREGGVETHDRPLEVKDDRERLAVALIQKKVAELLGSERFGSSFQMGMLASFESFMETTGVRRADTEAGPFYGPDQAEASTDPERDGLDVDQVNRIARSHFEVFETHLPHPKMDGVVKELAGAWTTGEKSLVFVRRVASVTELKRKLDERYDAWLIARLQRELPAGLQDRLGKLVAQYHEERKAAFERLGRGWEDEEDADGDRFDTFFAWFFRGDGPSGVVSGANVQQRFVQRGTAFSTFFDDNHAADVLGCSLDEVIPGLCKHLGVDKAQLDAQVRQRATHFLPRVKKQQRGNLFEAAQAAAIELLLERGGEVAARAKVVWEGLFQEARRPSHADEAPPLLGWLSVPTFFTELRRPERRALRQRLWPEPPEPWSSGGFRERVLRAQLLAAGARLGHAFIDLYVLTMTRLGSFSHRTRDEAEGHEGAAVSPIQEYLGLLETQMATPVTQRGFAAFDELAALGEHFGLILDVNAPEAGEQATSLVETPRIFGTLLGKQRPIGGMAGAVYPKVVRQFRMPGYPLVLVTTDVLQEGEDLHTFCSRVHHYGISWTPSAMEQRIGRIDRVRSLTDRRLSALDRPMTGADKLQVYFPHLKDSVELLQVRRVLERMNAFLRLMHEGLTTSGPEEKRIDTTAEFAREQRLVPQITENLKTAFRIRDEHKTGSVAAPLVGPELVVALRARFGAVAGRPLAGLEVRWDRSDRPEQALGTVMLGDRRQPFSLVLDSFDQRPLVRCISPVGRLEVDETWQTVLQTCARVPAKVGAILTEEERTYDLTVEEDVLLAADPATDPERIADLVLRTTREADRLEMIHRPGKDEPLETFKTQLQGEGWHER
jgi:superfamily II DNA or RNA helicase